MPRTRSLAWAQLKIGIVAVVAIALAIIFIIAVGGQGGFSWQRYELKTKFANVQGLKSGAIVRVAGVEVGKVTNIEFVGAEVQVAVEVNEEQQSRITDQSRASIGSLSLLGEPTIEISPASAGTPLKDGDFIQSERSAGQFSAAAENATQTLEQTTALIKELRAGRGTMGKLFTDDQLYREMNELIASAEAVTTAINGGRGTLGKLVNDPAMYQQANVAVANLQEITRRINAGEGSIGRLLHDDQMAKSLKFSQRQRRSGDRQTVPRRGNGGKAADGPATLRSFQFRGGAD